MMNRTGLFSLIAVAALVTACGGAPSAKPQSATACPMPIPGLRPVLDLSYPVPSSTAVPTNVGQIVFVGSYTGVTGNATLSMVTASNAAVPIGAFTAAPSPMPSPYAIPTGWGGDIPFVAVPVPTLSPSTTYTITYTYTDDVGAPPKCTGPITATSGSFTTL